MAHDDKIQLFEDKRIRTAWDEEKEEWYRGHKSWYRAPQFTQAVLNMLTSYKLNNTFSNYFDRQFQKVYSD